MPQEKFGEKFLAVKNDLTKTSYRFLKLKSTWLDSASSYKGVNAQLLTPEGYIFEMTTNRIKVMFIGFLWITLII